MNQEIENPASDDSLHVYNPAPIDRQEHKEGSVTQVLEQQAAKVPSAVFLTLSLMSMSASVVLEVTGHQRWSRFVGMWAPTLLTMGVYNKMVKMFGPR